MPDKRKEKSPKRKVGDIVRSKQYGLVRIAEVLESEDGEVFYRVVPLPSPKKEASRPVRRAPSRRGTSSASRSRRRTARSQQPKIKIGSRVVLKDGTPVRVLAVAQRDGETYYKVRPLKGRKSPSVATKGRRPATSLVAKVASLQEEEGTFQVVLSLQGALADKVKKLAKGSPQQRKFVESLLKHPAVRRAVATTEVGGKPVNLQDFKYGFHKESGLLHVALTYNVTTKEVSGDTFQPVQRADEAKKTKTKPESGVTKADESGKPASPQQGVERADEKKKASLTDEDMTRIATLAAEVADALLERGQITEEEKYWKADDLARKVATGEYTEEDLKKIKETLATLGADEFLTEDGTIVNVGKIIGDR